ncbi:MAG: hypothetical protein WCE90_09705 [Candidatus Zixiibacteriota bacterium]
MTNSLTQILSVLIEWLKAANQYAHASFGFWGQLAFDLVILCLVLLIAFKVTKAAINLVFYVAVPSLVLSFASSFILPFSFAVILPVCVALFMVISVFRS